MPLQLPADVLAAVLPNWQQAAWLPFVSFEPQADGMVLVDLWTIPPCAVWEDAVKSVETGRLYAELVLQFARDYHDPLIVSWVTAAMLRRPGREGDDQGGVFQQGCGGRVLRVIELKAAAVRTGFLKKSLGGQISNFHERQNQTEKFWTDVTSSNFLAFDREF